VNAKRQWWFSPRNRVLRESIESIVLGVALALLIRTFLIQAYKIPSGSMRPTLLEGDRLFVTKFTYRFRDPLPGEVTVFKYPEDRKREFIKRMVAGPGQRVSIRDGQAVVDGQPLTEAPFGQFVYMNVGTFLSEDAQVTVPEDSYFVLGDNSGSSRDSRYWGYVPAEDLVGRALIIFWPPSRWRVVR
jgi:signal peptidase I